MSGRKGNAAELRARGIAALLCGERPAVVARDLGVPEGTARSWKHRAKGRNTATLKKGLRGATRLAPGGPGPFPPGTVSRALRALVRDGAGELALAYGMLFDRTLRMLELHGGARGRGVRS